MTLQRSCLTNLKTLYDEMTGLVDQGKAVKVFNLDFSRCFNTVSHNIFIDKVEYWLDEWIVRWVKNWLNCHAQTFVISGTKFRRRLVTSGAPQGVVLRPIGFSVFIYDLEHET